MAMATLLMLVLAFVVCGADAAHADPISLLTLGSTLWSGLQAAAPALTLAGGAVGAFGALQAGGAANAAGKAQQQALTFRAQQEKQAADEARAVAQRQAQDERRKGNLLQSTLIARAAASGASASDPTVLDLGGDIAQRSEYNALTDMYRGENRARGLTDTATGDILSGDAAAAGGAAAQTGSYFKAAGGLLQSTGMAARFNDDPYARRAAPTYG